MWAELHCTASSHQMYLMDSVGSWVQCSLVWLACTARIVRHVIDGGPKLCPGTAGTLCPPPPSYWVQFQLSITANGASGIHYPLFSPFEHSTFAQVTIYSKCCLNQCNHHWNVENTVSASLLCVPLVCTTHCTSLACRDMPPNPNPMLASLLI